MEAAMLEDLEKQMQNKVDKLDNLALQVGNIEQEIFSEDGNQIEVFTLLKSVNEVKSNYQNLRKEISEVQDLQKQLSSTLQVQIRVMQSKFHTLKEKIIADKQLGQSSSSSSAPHEEMSSSVPNLLLDTPEQKYGAHGGGEYGSVGGQFARNSDYEEYCGHPVYGEY